MGIKEEICVIPKDLHLNLEECSRVQIKQKKCQKIARISKIYRGYFISNTKYDNEVPAVALKQEGEGYKGTLYSPKNSRGKGCQISFRVTTFFQE